MRFGCLFGGFFWGALVILLGIGLLLNTVFGISIPVFQILFGLLFIYLGLRVLSGGHRGFGRRNWGERYHFDHARPGDRHDVAFGRSDIDLTGVVLQNETVQVEVNTAFGSSDIRIDSRMPVKILASVTFGGVRLPDSNATAFGEHVWKSPGLDESKPYLMLHISCAFGGVRVSRR